MMWCIWFCRLPQPYQMEISQYNDMDSVWVTFSIIRSFRWAFRSQGHSSSEVKERLNGIFYVLMVWCMFLDHFSPKTLKMTLEHFLNGPNRTKFENSENTEIAGTASKMAVSTFKIGTKTRSFSRYHLNFCTHKQLIEFFQIHSTFLIRKLSPVLWK